MCGGQEPCRDRRPAETQGDRAPHRRQGHFRRRRSAGRRALCRFCSQYLRPRQNQADRHPARAVDPGCPRGRDGRRYSRGFGRGSGRSGTRYKNLSAGDGQSALCGRADRRRCRRKSLSGGRWDRGRCGGLRSLARGGGPRESDERIIDQTFRRAQEQHRL